MEQDLGDGLFEFEEAWTYAKKLFSETRPKRNLMNKRHWRQCFGCLDDGSGQYYAQEAIEQREAKQQRKKERNLNHLQKGGVLLTIGGKTHYVSREEADRLIAEYRAR